MPRLIKVGFTTRSIEERIQELSSTGVPGRFEVEFYCGVDNASSLERAVHSKLSKHRYKKEFFRCDLEVAVRFAKEALLAGGHSVFATGGRSRNAFITDQEREELRRTDKDRRRNEAAVARRNKAREREIRRLDEARAREIRRLEQKFLQLAPVVERAVRSHCALGKHETIKTIGKIALAFTGVGLLLFHKISPPAFDDGLKTAKKLSKENIGNAREFFGVVQELRSLDAFSPIAERYYKNQRYYNSKSAKSEQQFLIEQQREKYDVSSLFMGVFHGLKQYSLEFIASFKAKHPNSRVVVSNKIGKMEDVCWIAKPNNDRNKVDYIFLGSTQIDLRLAWLVEHRIPHDWGRLSPKSEIRHYENALALKMYCNGQHVETEVTQS